MISVANKQIILIKNKLKIKFETYCGIETDIKGLATKKTPETRFQAFIWRKERDSNPR